MDPSSGRGSDPCVDVGCSHGRFVCHQAEQTAPAMLLSPARRRSLRNGQLVGRASSLMRTPPPLLSSLLT
jgi:hypothetical protein